MWRIHTYSNDYFCETKQNQCYSLIEKKQSNLDVRSQSFPLLEFSPALESWSDIYTSPSSCLIVTPIVTKYYRTHYDQWCCLHWMPRHDKFLTVNYCRVLFMTYWHKFQMIFNGRFVASSVDRPRQDNCRVRCKRSLLLFRRHFPLLFFYLSALSSASWVDTPLTADWLQVCFGTGLTQFSKAFKKNAYPTFNTF